MAAFSTIGVVGAGVMGRGVAQALAQTAHAVVLVDVDDETLRAAREEIHRNLRMSGFFRREEAVDPDEAIARILFTADREELRAADFLVENVTEDIDLKRDLYGALDGICPSGCVFAANTSAIAITRIGSWTERPDRVVGMHFMNPVPMKPAVEVIRGYHTSPETLEAARAFLDGMGKKAIVVEDSPGFVSNRVLMLTVNEAIFLVHEGVAAAEQVDEVFRSCFGHPMGPLATADLIGLDTILLSLEVLYESYNDPKFRPCPLLRKMVDAGLHGRKSGKGFFPY